MSKVIEQLNLMKSVFDVASGKILEREKRLMRLIAQHETKYTSVFEDVDGGTKSRNYAVNSTLIKSADSGDHTMYYVVESAEITGCDADSEEVLNTVLPHITNYEFSRESEHCEHEHDCCGNVYASSAHVQLCVEGLIIITQSFVHNV